MDGFIKPYKTFMIRKNRRESGELGACLFEVEFCLITFV